jgi:hypothetical protein
MYHRELEQANDEPLSNQAYGAAALYCCSSTLPATHKLFLAYLHEEQDDIMTDYYKEYLKTKMVDNPYSPFYCSSRADTYCILTHKFNSSTAAQIRASEPCRAK